MTPDEHEFRWQRDSHGNKCQYVCRMGTKYRFKATAAAKLNTNVWGANHDTHLSAKKVCEKEKEAIEESSRNPTATSRTVLGNLSVNLTTQNVNAVS